MTPLNRCPICGSRKIQRVHERVTLHPRGRAVQSPVVEFDRCEKCGEMFFDQAASRKIDAALVPQKQRKSA